jgi:hypothetical protein
VIKIVVVVEMVGRAKLGCLLMTCGVCSRYLIGFLMNICLSWYRLHPLGYWLLIEQSRYKNKNNNKKKKKKETVRERERVIVVTLKQALDNEEFETVTLDGAVSLVRESAVRAGLFPTSNTFCTDEFSCSGTPTNALPTVP